MRDKKYPVVLYPIWLADGLYVIPAGLAVGSFFMTAFWFMVGYKISPVQIAVMVIGGVVSLAVLWARSLFRKRARKQHPNVHLRFL